jgi:hypothetical protein
VIYLKLAAAIAALLGVLYAAHAQYESGFTAGSNQIQVKWDRDLAARQKVTDDAIAQASKTHEAELAANQDTITDANNQIASLRSLNGNLAARLRNISASAGACGSPVPKAGDQPGAASAPIKITVGQINDALAAALTECAVNRANYAALIKEIKGQL